MTQHEWSESGKELLKAFKIEIANSGGRESLLKIIKAEQNRSRLLKTKQSTCDPSTESKIFSMWHKYSTPKIARYLDLSESTILRKAYFLGLSSNKCKEKPNTDGKNGRLVLNTETGIYYDSTVKAAFSAGMITNRLNRKLIGEYRNNTSFIRV